MCKKIFCFITIFLLSANIVLASPKDTLKDMDSISNSLNTLFLSTLKGSTYEQVEKDIKFIESQISQEKKEILNDIESTKGDEKTSYLALLSILNYYEISTIKIRNYFENNDSEALITSIAAFKEGESILSTVKSVLLK